MLSQKLMAIFRPSGLLEQALRPACNELMSNGKVASLGLKNVELENFGLKGCLLNRNLSTHTGFSYNGDPFATKITMKREVKDISRPDFEKQECLKWANWRMLRDVKRRHINAEYWQYRLNLKNLVGNRGLPSVIRDIALEERQATPRASSCCFVRARCAISSRSRGKYRRYRISRIIWRDLADHGLLSGVIRAKWG